MRACVRRYDLRIAPLYRVTHHRVLGLYNTLHLIAHIRDGRYIKSSTSIVTQAFVSLYAIAESYRNCSADTPVPRLSFVFPLNDMPIHSHYDSHGSLAQMHSIALAAPWSHHPLPTQMQVVFTHLVLHLLLI